MKYRYLSIFLILMILSIGAVSAQENATTDGNVPNVQSNVSSEVVITDDNYNNYFNSTTGKILENSNISDGSTIKLGNVSNKIFSIDKILTITSNSSSDVLTNVSFTFNSGSDGSIIEYLNINSNNAKNNAFNVNASDIEILNNQIKFVGAEDAGNIYAIYAEFADNLIIQDNFIQYTGKSKGDVENHAIFVKNSEDVVLSNNTLRIVVPASDVDWSTGFTKTDGVAFLRCDRLGFDSNSVRILCNDTFGSYPSIYAVNIEDSDSVIVQFGEVVLDSNANYTYCIKVSGENFIVGGGSLWVNYATNRSCNYVCGVEVAAPFTGEVVDTDFILFSEKSAYGVYAADWSDSNSSVNISSNKFSILSNTAFAISLYGISKSVIEDNVVSFEGNYTTGIASNAKEITISKNIINASGSNVGTPLGFDDLGVETVGVHIVSGNATITNNILESNGDHAVHINGTGKVTVNNLLSKTFMGDVAVNATGNVIVENNIPMEGAKNYNVTNDTIFLFLDGEQIRDDINSESLTFIGPFSNVIGEELNVIRPIKLFGDNATFYDISMIIAHDNVTVDGFTFILDSVNGYVISVDGNNVSLTNNIIKFKAIDWDYSHAISVFLADNVLIDNNTVYFSAETNNTFKYNILVAEESNNLTISNNMLLASLPARPIDWASGTVYSEGVYLNDCNNSVVYNNTIGVKSNGKISEYDTIYALHIFGDNATVEKNIIGTIEAPYGYGLVVSGEDFTIDENKIYVGQNETYSCGIDIESNSNGAIFENLIVTVGESSYGIYTADWAGPVAAYVGYNTIVSNGTTVFGMSLSGFKSLVEYNNVIENGNYTTGIASAVSNITIANNTIIANGSNVGTPAGYDSMGIETTGIHIVGGNAAVIDNDITTTGDFAVDTEDNAEGNVTNNCLEAKELTGDASVKYVPGQEIVVEKNTPAMEKVFILADDVIMFYKNGTRYVVTLNDIIGNPLANKKVIITINGVSYNRTTNENGTTSMAINLNSGSYKASAAYVNETGQINAIVNNFIEVVPTVFADDLVKVFRNASQYYATFVDGQGCALPEGTNVTFNINGVMYTRKTNENGTAKLNINLQQGTYVITAINPVNGEMHANNITVLPTITDNSDLVKYYRNASQYVVTLVGEDGKAVGAGENVTFNINGVMYTRTTNATGQAKLNINLDPGNYTITAEYKKCKVSNNIEVKPVLSAKDIIIKQGTSDQFRAKLLDGQGKPYAGQKITFNINGIFYNRTTDADGYAALTIRLTAAVNTYIITSSYNGTNIANKISIVD